MEDVFNTPHTCKVELEVLGHKLLLAQMSKFGFSTLDFYGLDKPTAICEGSCKGDMAYDWQDPNSKHLGTTVWDSSIVFVKYLEKNSKKGEFSRAKLRGKRVIELGAGCGLSGLGMALLGCKVVVTDQVAVLPLLLRNMERNMARASYSASEYTHLGPIGSVEIAELDWGDDSHVKLLDPPFDYIIGTDVVYKEYLLPPLLESVLALSGPRTTLLLGYEFRASGVREQLHELFSRHFEIKKIPHAKMDSKYQHPNIDLFIMRYRNSSVISVPSQHSSEDTDPQSVQESANEGCLVSAIQSEKSDCDTESVPGYNDTAEIPTTTGSTSTSKASSYSATKDTHENEQGSRLGSDTTLASSDGKCQRVSSEGHDAGVDVRAVDWGAGRLGSMAARLLRDVCIPHEIMNVPSP